MEFIAVVKRECETCKLVEPVLAQIRAGAKLAVYCQDDPAFPEALGGAIDDRELDVSWKYRIEVTPTLIRVDGGNESERTEGWNRADWERVSRVSGLGKGLPASQPGCGSHTMDPGMPERLALRHGDLKLKSRPVEVNDPEDAIELAYDQGWTDGLPVVPPTPLRVARMLSGTNRRPDEVIGLIPPNLSECTVEKVAVNAVMAGCLPEYFPVVLSVLETALEPQFSMHGLLATLWFSGPVIIVNGPITKRIGMNAAGNVFGQGNRANATIGRALQLIIRNVGGGVPGGVDRAVFGQPGKYTFCFPEDESDPEWVPLNVARGFAKGTSTVTLFHGDGVQGIAAHKSRTPEQLARSIAMGLCAVCHPKSVEGSGAILAISPDHYAIFKAGGWGRAEIEAGLREALKRPGRDLVQGAHGVEEGIDPSRAEQMVDKFNDGALLVVRAGGRGGLMSAVIGGWSAQRRSHEVQPVTREIAT